MSDTPTITFADLNFDPVILKSIEECGYTVPTPIQAQAIPVALTGSDMIASANTGTGKTAAFVLPALQRLQAKSDTQGFGPRVLVLTPTRELAIQVLDAVKKYSKYSRVFTGLIIGGSSYRDQMKMLSRQVDIIVGTPGRLMDQIQRKQLNLAEVEMLVLDEADRMLDMGFLDEVEAIAAECPAGRQTLMFTATFDNAMTRLAKRLLNEPKYIDIAGKQRSQDTIDQRLLRADDLGHKHRLLEHLVADPEVNKAVIFAATKRDADRLADELSDQGHAAAALHGDMHQRERNRTVESLRRGRIKLLVATDVAARGIDIADLTHVINFDLPRVAEDYVHRIGRTGRAGASGIAWSFVTRAEGRQIKTIEQYMGKQLTFQVIPGLEPRQTEARGPRPAGDKGGKPFHARDGQNRDGQKRFGGPRTGSFDARANDNNGGAPARGDRPARTEHSARTDRPARAEYPARTDRPARAEHPARAERPAYTDRPVRAERPARAEHAPRTDRPAHAERPRAENGDRPQKSFKPKWDRPRGENRSENRPASGERRNAGSPGGFKPMKRQARAGN